MLKPRWNQYIFGHWNRGPPHFTPLKGGINPSCDVRCQTRPISRRSWRNIAMSLGRSKKSHDGIGKISHFGDAWGESNIYSDDTKGNLNTNWEEMAVLVFLLIGAEKMLVFMICIYTALLMRNIFNFSWKQSERLTVITKTWGMWMWNVMCLLANDTGSQTILCCEGVLVILKWWCSPQCMDFSYISHLRLGHPAILPHPPSSSEDP